MVVRAGWGVAVVLVCGAGQAQTLGTVAGAVTDPSGATVAQAQVTLQPLDPGGGKVQSATTDREGRYTFTSGPGEYVLVVKATGFAESTSEPFTVAAGAPSSVDVRLRIEEQMQQVDVASESGMDTDPSQNGDQLVLKGSDIASLPLQSDQLLQELQGLAGGNSPEIYLNGFSGGQLPPRDTIREIRINQNPYSAQNDTNPVNGRIEILTKPGGGQFHGDFDVNGNTAGLNAPNPFFRSQPSYYSDALYAGVNGPISKHAGFQANANVNDNQTNTAVDAQVLDANLNPVTLTEAVPQPTTTTFLSGRVDLSVGTKSTVMVQYSLYRTAATNGGVGQLTLAEQGYDSATTAQTLQVSNSQILSAKVVNDTRFQYVRSRMHQLPDSVSPALVVQGSFNGGGSNAGKYNDNQDRYELQNYVSAALKTHYFNFGGRLRATRDANESSANYNGQYTFATLTSYQLTLAGQKAGLTPAQIRASGGGASQFSQTAGNPGVAVSVVDGALYFQDDWKVRKNVTLSPGLRFETQNQISDHADFAPRLGVAYSFDQAKDKPPAYVLRGGLGVFYRRFTSGNVLQAARQNGVTQQQYVVNSPDTYPAIPPLSGLGVQTSSTVYQISPSFRAPYLLSATASLQRQLGTHGSVTATYLETRGMHDQLTRNINAPLPGTYDLTSGVGVRPMGGTQNIYQYESGGVDRNHRLNINSRLQFADKFFLWQNYAFQYVRADTSGGFPSNQYNLGQDYGRANNDIRNVLSMGGYAQLPFGFTAGGYLRLTSGAPFNITVGQDLNGDTQFNDRPAFATDLTRPSVVQTAYGNFDMSPVAGQTIIPINYGKGPGYAALNFEVGKHFSFGPVVKPAAGEPAPKLKAGEKPKVEHRFLLEFTVSGSNVFNHVNYALPVGVLPAQGTQVSDSSTLFGKSTGTLYGGAANRTVNLETYFHF